jgi:dimethylargininase
MLIALTRPVPRSINRCELTHLAREPIDYDRATEQHAAYEHALESLGCTIRRLSALDEMPDSVFIEDTAVVLPEVTIIAHPGAESRRAEVNSVAAALQEYRPVVPISDRAGRALAAGGTPALLDGGDVLVIGKWILVGRSARTNDAGIDQLRRIVETFGYRVTAVEVRECLHLKSAATSVGDAMLCNPRWIDATFFNDPIEVDPSEPYAANALDLDGTVLFPEGYPRTRERLERRGVRVRTVEADELAKAEGGLTCCSIIFKQ